MADMQREQAKKVYDEVTKFEVVEHYNDGDQHDSRESASWLIQAREKIDGFIEHLHSIPFQGDR